MNLILHPIYNAVGNENDPEWTNFTFMYQQGIKCCPSGDRHSISHTKSIRHVQDFSSRFYHLSFHCWVSVILFPTYAYSQHIISTLGDTSYCTCRSGGSPNNDETQACCGTMQNDFGGLKYSVTHSRVCRIPAISPSTRNSLIYPLVRLCNRSALQLSDPMGCLLCTIRSGRLRLWDRLKRRKKAFVCHLCEGAGHPAIFPRYTTYCMLHTYGFSDFYSQLDICRWIGSKKDAWMYRQCAAIKPT